MQRISVIGASGCGKTSLARALAARLELPCLELDSIFHQPDWKPLETEVFRARVGEFTAAEHWVVDGNYSAVRDLVWGRADTVVFLDLPRWRVMSQLVPRTLGRMTRGVELWNGNRERLANLFSLDPERNLLLWSWRTHRKHQVRFERAVEDAHLGHVAFHRLRSREAIARFLAGCATRTPRARAAPAEA